MNLNVSKADYEVILALIGEKQYETRIDLERCHNAEFKKKLEARLKYWQDFGTRLAGFHYQK